MKLGFWGVLGEWGLAVTPNAPPIISVYSNKSVYEAGEVIILTATGSDSDTGDTLTYLWSSGETTPAITVTAPTGSTNTTVSRSCTVSDGEATATDSVTVNVLAEVIPNRPPTITVITNKSTYSAGETIVWTAAVNDLDNDTLSVLWSTGETSLSFTSIAASNTVNSQETRSCTVMDGQLTAQSSTVVNIVAVANNLPVLNLASNKPEYEAGEVIILTATGSDVDANTTLTYTWSTGEIGQILAFVAPTGSSASTITRSCTISDGRDSVTRSITVNVNALVLPDNAPNLILLSNKSTYEAGEEIILTAFSYDVDGDSVTIEWEDSSTSAIRTLIAPTAAENSVLSFNCTASDGENNTVVNISVNINAVVDHLPEILSTEFYLYPFYYFTAYRGKSNREVATFKPTTNVNFPLKNECINFSRLEVDKIEIVIGENILSTDTGEIEFNDEVVKFKIPNSVPKGRYFANFILYLNGDEEGVVLAGEGFPNTTPVIVVK